jgi:hypothetical protein
VRARLPAGVRLACAFKTVPAHLVGAGFEPLDCDEFICGDSADARADAAALVALVPGLRPVDVGPLSRARSIEHMTALAIAINRRHKIHDARFRVGGFPRFSLQRSPQSTQRVPRDSSLRPLRAAFHPFVDPTPASTATAGT